MARRGSELLVLDAHVEDTRDIIPEGLGGFSARVKFASATPEEMAEFSAVMLAQEQIQVYVDPKAVLKAAVTSMNATKCRYLQRDSKVFLKVLPDLNIGKDVKIDKLPAEKLAVLAACLERPEADNPDRQAALCGVESSDIRAWLSHDEAFKLYYLALNDYMMEQLKGMYFRQAMAQMASGSLTAGTERFLTQQLTENRREGGKQDPDEARRNLGVARMFGRMTGREMMMVAELLKKRAQLRIDEETGGKDTNSLDFEVK